MGVHLLIVFTTAHLQKEAMGEVMSVVGTQLALTARTMDCILGYIHEIVKQVKWLRTEVAELYDLCKKTLVTLGLKLKLIYSLKKYVLVKINMVPSYCLKRV